MRDPNVLLDALIDEAGMSHDGFAARVNQAGARHGLVPLYDHASVRRWIRDATVPRGLVPELICGILAGRLSRPVSLADAGLDRGGGEEDAASLAQALDGAAALWRSDRKQAAGLQSARPVQGPAAIAPVYEWENPPDDLDVSRHAGRSVSREQVCALQAARVRYERMYRDVGGIPVRPRIVEVLVAHAAPLVRGAYDDATGRDLYRAAGGLAALAGICAYDADLQGAAQRYYFQALRMAKASGDRGFGGYVVALLANQALYSARGPRLRPAVRRRRAQQPPAGPRPPAGHPRHHPGRAGRRRARRRDRHADARPGHRDGIAPHRGTHHRRVPGARQRARRAGRGRGRRAGRRDHRHQPARPLVGLRYWPACGGPCTARSPCTRMSGSTSGSPTSSCPAGGAWSTG